MKSFIIVFGLVSLASASLITPETPQEKTKFVAIHKKCQADPKTFVDEDLVTKTIQGIFTEDQQLKIHMLCMNQGFNYIQPGGGLNEAILKQKWSAHYDGSDYTNLLKCLVNKSNDVETSWDMLICKHKTVGHLG
ncbi:unnamed protein product [Brassicogethes aeneus]|uniref:Uncharacterized protein n=1 Tax=Brassicogethes aeneus TaxID=1431903 RepID=A0A9P0FEQ4_BRAAE|nr:unnamed protein product [Brassicogethes aeneus]